MKLNRKYILIVVPIILILLIVGYSIKKSTPVNTNTNNSSSSIKGAGANTSGDSASSTNKNSNQNATATPTPAPTAKTVAPSAPPDAKLSAPNIDQVKNLMKQLSSEKQVSASQIFIKNNMHFATITFKKEADSKDANEFATKYANLIKQAYNDNNVYVEIVQEDKTIATILLK